MCEEEAEPGKLHVLMIGPPPFAKEERESANRPHGELVGSDQGVGNGIEDKPELMKNAERDRDHDLGS
jgi:hypothetical protein